MGVAVEQPERDLVKRRLNLGDLGEDVDAVAVLLGHPLDATDLALDPGETGEQLVLGRGVAARGGGGR